MKVHRKRRTPNWPAEASQCFGSFFQTSRRFSRETDRSRALVLLFASAGLAAQTPSFSTSLVDPESSLDGSAGQVSLPKGDASSSHTLTRFALGFGVSPLGLQLAATTNVSKNLNLRATGNFFNYSTNFNSSGISATGKLSLASMGVDVDYYPLHLPIRISPGLLLYNGNQLTATANVPGGDSFTLNGKITTRPLQIH